MSDDNRLTNSFEKASQEYFKESWEFGWTAIGVVMLLVLVLFGIYFSQVAIASWIGVTGLMLYFTWAAAISISALEVSGIKLLGDKIRSIAISSSNKAEHTISKWFTYLLFLFDIFTNWTGLYLTVVEVMKNSTPARTTIDMGGWIIILFFGALMAISEILVGWTIRAVATSYTSFLQAKQKYDCYKLAVEKNVLEGISHSNLGSNPKYQDDFRPQRNQSIPHTQNQSSFRNEDRELGFETGNNREKSRETIFSNLKKIPQFDENKNKKSRGYHGE